MGVGKESNSNSRIPESKSSFSSSSLAAPRDVESLNSFFSGGTNSNSRAAAQDNNQSDEQWLPVAMKQIRMYTLIGSVVPVFMSVKAMIELDFLTAIFCLSSSVALILCCVYGHQRRDWRFLLGVGVIAALLGGYSGFLFCYTLNAMLTNFYSSHTELIKQGYGSLGVMIAYRVIKCVSYVFAFIYWGLVAYANEKLTRIFLAESRSDAQQQQQQQIRGIGHEAEADAKDERKGGQRPPIDRDLTRAETFAELAPYSSYPPSPAARGNVIGVSPSSYTSGYGEKAAAAEAKSGGSQKLSTFDRVLPGSGRPAEKR